MTGLKVDPINKRSDPRVPATVLVGFLGSGKTTLLNSLLHDQHGRKLAVVVNDFSEVNIDGALVRHSTDRIVEMTNGCICCTLREDLVEELQRLSEIDELEGIIIESTGIGEPLPIAQAFHMEDLPDRVNLQEIVTVVDSANFWRDFERSDRIEDAEGNLVDAPLAPLLVDQLEFTNIVLLNKADIAPLPDVDRLERFVRDLNPQARIYRTQFGDIDAKSVFATGLYDYDLAPESEKWEENWNLDSQSEADEYGFNSFTYVASLPMEYAAFMRLFDDWPDEVLRAKGFATFSDHDPIMLSVVRDSLEIQILESLQFGDADGPAGEQPFVLPTARMDDEEVIIACEVVFIGRNMPVEEFVQRLDNCLATDGS